MSYTACRDTMAKKNTQYQLRCSEAWLARVQRAAEAKDIPVAMYIRQAVSAAMDADGVPPEVHPKRGKPPRPAD